MNVEWKLFAGGAAFAAVVSAIYWFVTSERAGTTMLLLSGAAMLMVAAYLVVVGSRSGRRPSDRPDADPADDVEHGTDQSGGVYYPSRSVWPFVAASGSVVLGYGMVFGLGVGSLGLILLIAAVAGYAAEANAKR